MTTHAVRMIPRIARLMSLAIRSDAGGWFEVEIAFGVHRAAVLKAFGDVAFALRFVLCR